jgi:hypothetical protein
MLAMTINKMSTNILPTIPREGIYLLLQLIVLTFCCCLQRLLSMNKRVINGVQCNVPGLVLHIINMADKG